jgi:hypothetical protein
VTDDFEEYIKIVHNPRFVSVSRQTMTRDPVKYYAGCRAKLVEVLGSRVNSVALIP